MSIVNGTGTQIRDSRVPSAGATHHHPVRLARSGGPHPWPVLRLVTHRSIRVILDAGGWRFDGFRAAPLNSATASSEIVSVRTPLFVLVHRGGGVSFRGGLLLVDLLVLRFFRCGADTTASSSPPSRSS